MTYKLNNKREKMTRLLILACSARKNPETLLLPAIERYTAPPFVLVRRYLKTNHKADVDILILSAEYGLIAADHTIANYDRKMTPERVIELQSPVDEKLNTVLAEKSYQEVCLGMSKLYLKTFDNFNFSLYPELQVTKIVGGFGKVLAELHYWLYGESAYQKIIPTKMDTKTKPKFKGIELDYKPEEILEVAREAIRAGDKSYATYQVWYILVDQYKVSPKWLVSRLTHVPQSEFHSETARKILQQLGIEYFANESRKKD
jgi:hypothetical protein